MTATAELPIALPAPEFSAEEIGRLVEVLRQAEGWLTAREIAARMGAGMSDRTVRAMASVACPAVVSFPGSPGYKLWQRCTVEEVGRAIRAFESQGHDMIKRAVLYRQAYHRRYGGAPA